MKRNASDKEFYKHCAIEYNKMRIHFGSKIFYHNDFYDYGKENGMPYYAVMFKLFRDNGVLVGGSLSGYKFAPEPIHYSFFEKHNPREHNKNPSRKRRRHKRFETQESENSLPIMIDAVQPVKHHLTIKQYTDAEIVAELRERGFEVSAKKIIEL